MSLKNLSKIIVLFFILLFNLKTIGQQCIFETSNGTQSATYFEVINWYKNLDKISNKIFVQETGNTDAGYPLHLVLVSNDGKFDAIKWHKQNKAVILINNGIHPGEPDGIDATMMLIRDIAIGKIKIPNNIALAVIPVYNIGGCLNRNSLTRVNQNGPLEYGFRGNAQNLDLNRDFTKCDSKEAKTFATIFHLINPEIFIDNHVSDGADYQHTMTLLTTQYNKLGADLGTWLKEIFEPQIFNGMTNKKWDMVPYVNFETTDFNKGMEMFYDPPRYSTGYTSLFNTIGFMPETHMLKSFKERVLASYDLMQIIIEKTALNADELILKRNVELAKNITKKNWPMSWVLDTTRFDYITFKGYQQDYKISEATGLAKMFYNHNKPYTSQIKYYNTFTPTNFIIAPTAYVIPQGWSNVIDLLKLNNVECNTLKNDTIITVEVYHIDDYKTMQKAYEKHHKNSNVKLTTSIQKIKFFKGDYFISLNQISKRYIIEMLEPYNDDSFFAWNFFDAILQQKEGYSDYRWDDLAAIVLQKNTTLKQKFNDKKINDSIFAKNASAQLDFIYKNSEYYEKAHNRYPVYRLM